MTYTGIKEALASVASYNGWHDTLCEIRDYIEAEKEKIKTPYGNIHLPDFISEMDSDLYPRVIWFIMVEMFGTCGTSPRTGWIEIENIKEALQFINDLCDMSYIEDCDE